MTARRAAERRSARDRLKGRQVRRGHYDVVVGDGDLSALTARLDEAQEAVRVAQGALDRVDDEKGRAQRKGALDAATERRDVADAALAEQVERLWFKALPGTEYEALRVENPAPKKRDGEGKERTDYATLWPLTPILAARCAEDPDFQDEDYWRAELPEWPLPDRLGLQAVLLEINTTPANAELAGKAFGITKPS